MLWIRWPTGCCGARGKVLGAGAAASPPILAGLREDEESFLGSVSPGMDGDIYMMMVKGYKSNRRMETMDE